MKPSLRVLSPLILAMMLFGALPALAQSSVAYGSLNNFDAVNNTGVECHGFEIEIEDAHSTDITYTYDYNHYGVPKISEDNSDPLHPRVFIRYESAKNPDGSWAAFTAVPAAPIDPSNGHQFTNPSVNFGGEHFGVGFYGNRSNIKYSWLIDDGAGNLVFGGAVNISTPSFTYSNNQGVARVQAAIVPPPPPEVPVLEFGDPMWVKVTVTQSHNNNKVELRDLVSDDPDDPNDRNWKNGEPDEVEIEWQLLQTEFNQVNGGANGELDGVPEELPEGDEIITRRYDFFEYAGPIDAETGEAKSDKVGPDDLHGIGIKIINGVEVDLSTVVVVGDYVGAQMAGFDPAGQIGLIDHLQDGEVNVPYVDRSIVIGGTPPIVTTRTGNLPAGMDFDEVTGILSGTPTVTGFFNFTVHSTDASAGDVTKTYNLNIADAGGVLPAHSVVTTSAAPPEGGATSGDGDYENGVNVSVNAVANPGFAFVNWTEAGTEVSTSETYSFVIDQNHDLVANFVPTFAVATSASPAGAGTTTGDGTYNDGDSVTVTATGTVGFVFVNWTEDGAEVSTSASYQFNIGADRNLVANFAELITITTQASPPEGGTTSGDGQYQAGDNVTVTAVPNAGYAFVNWTSNGVEVSTLDTFSFAAGVDGDLVANFSPIGPPPTLSYLYMSSPTIGGFKTFGIILLSGPAGPNGAVVHLSSWQTTRLQVPAAVNVAPGASAAFFLADTTYIVRPTSTGVTASLNNSQKSALVKIMPLWWFLINPASGQ